MARRQMARAFPILISATMLFATTTKSTYLKIYYRGGVRAHRVAALDTLYSLAIAISNYRVQFLNVIHLSNIKFHRTSFYVSVNISLLCNLNLYVDHTQLYKCHSNHLVSCKSRQYDLKFPYVVI